MVKIRTFESGDIEGCLALLQAVHVPDFSRARFEWLHFKNPLAPSQIVIAEYNRKIIGLYSATKKNIYINGNNFIGARDVDPVVHPTFRGQGIFTQMLDFSLGIDSRIDFHYNFKNISSRQGFVTDHQWTYAELQAYPVLCQLYGDIAQHRTPGLN